MDVVRGRVSSLLTLLFLTLTLTLTLTGLVASPAFAGDIAGRVSDRTGAVLPGASVRLLTVSSGIEQFTVTDAAGAYRFTGLGPGVYRVAAGLPGFSDASRTVVMHDGNLTLTADFSLELGTIRAEVTVSAARGERDTRVVPLRVDTLDGDAIRRLAMPSTGDALVSAPGVTPVGSGPFQIRPRLRGLDSTRVLLLVDGERLNNARTATDRAGVEVGLVNTDAIEGVEVLGGAGSVLYGTDALAGTINILTNQPRYASAPRFQAGFDGLYSSNEDGRRGTVTVGFSNTRWAVRFAGGAEAFDDYRAGGDFRESTTALVENGTIQHVDTADALGFEFGAFPDPFNAPFTRESDVVARSGMRATSANLAALVRVTPGQELSVKYQRRHASDIGFPDFEAPTFFQTITLPWSRLDKVSADYAFTGLTDWLPRLSVGGYYQVQDRQLRNEIPVQFPVPSPGFFPVNIFRLEITSETRQRVWTPGVDVQATFLPRPNNVLTVGTTMFRDRSEDERTSQTATTIIGNVGFGPGGRPQATVFPAPVLLDPGQPTHPTRVPDASFLDLGFFAHDEWDVTPALRLTGGLRLDRYRVTTDPTPGYDVEDLVAGADPAIDPSTLPNVNGERVSRTAVTGEAGIVLWASRPVSVFGHYVRSYRHPNLEELLFSGPATAGNIVPNVTVEPETGHNLDVGARVRASHVSGSAAYFVNRYAGFISTEVVAGSDLGSISQAINLADVRIQGLEAQAHVPFAAGGLLWSPWAQLAVTRGTVLSGTSPMGGASLDGAPQDNITPWKLSTGLRVSDDLDRWWGAWDVRAQGDVTRVSPLLSDSPFLIAQDLLALDGFAVHRVAAGYVWRRGERRLGLTLSVDNLGNRFYREQFQFAPARGRSISLAVNVLGVQ
jgi:outer membrane receptor protein involved in Fe transport